MVLHLHASSKVLVIHFPSQNQSNCCPAFQDVFAASKKLRGQLCQHKWLPACCSWGKTCRNKETCCGNGHATVHKFHHCQTKGQMVMLQRYSSKACTHSWGSRTGTLIAAAARRPSAFLHCKSHFTWVGSGEARLLKCFFTRSLWQFCRLFPWAPRAASPSKSVALLPDKHAALAKAWTSAADSFPKLNFCMRSTHKGECSGSLPSTSSKLVLAFLFPLLCLLISRHMVEPFGYTCLEHCACNHQGCHRFIMHRAVQPHMLNMV